MIHAYDKVYLSCAQTSLGRMFDFVVYDLGFKIEDFLKIFIKSNISERFASGDFTLITGMSGIELAYKVLDSLNIKYERIRPKFTQNRSEEYWCGWVLAYYQWITNMSFRDILEYIDILEIISMYDAYHEMDIKQFVDKMNELYKERKKDTNIKIYRLKSNYSQKQLAEMTGIPIRTLQQYEQRQKNINKAQAEYLVALSEALCCDIKKLFELNED